MKLVFSFIVFIHGLIHLIGFFKTLQSTEVTHLMQGLSKPMGMLWLFASGMFSFAAILFYLKEKWWVVIVIIAIVISQILIVMYWKDAKYGTTINIIILLVTISTLGNRTFNKMVQQESKELFENIRVEKASLVTKSDLSTLPNIVQLWMENSGVIGKEKTVSVRLKQRGKMRTKPESKWMSFEATQYFNVEDPSFVWFTQVKALSIIGLVGRDKLLNGEGEMLIKLASLIPIVNEERNEKLNSGTMIRFLSEICWFPSATLNEYITWEVINETSAKATFTYNSKSISGIFKFNKEGNLVSFEADRYYGAGKESTLRKWIIQITDYKLFEGVKIPNKCKVTWQLPKGNFDWLIFEVIDASYNSIALYDSKN